MGSDESSNEEVGCGGNDDVKMDDWSHPAGRNKEKNNHRNSEGGEIDIIKEKLETLSAMESYLPTSDRHAASWIFSDGPSKQLGVVKLRYNALKLFFYNVAILRQRACFRQRLQTRSIALHTSWLINKDCLY